MSNRTSADENIVLAEKYMARFASQPLNHLIEGAEVASESDATFENFSPIDGTAIGQVAAGTEVEIDKAARAAAEAFKEWSQTPGSERKRVLNRVADLIDSRSSEIAITECCDTGQTMRFMKAAASRGATNFRYFADKAPEARNGKSLPATDHVNYTTRSPIGPVGVITPWNTPFMLSTWKIAPALASGCTVVHKPAEWSPYSAHLLAEIALEAGLPPGVLNVVHGFGETAGLALTEHDDIKAIAFVGESRTGSLIQAQGAPSLKRLHFELGGKNPIIVFADANLERAADAAIFMIYSLNGERCTSSSRLLVQASIQDEFLDRLETKMAEVPVGHPLDPESVIGPMIHPSHRDKVLSYQSIARSEGAEVRLGSAWSDAPEGGNWVSPMLFSNATPDMRIAREEIFGPVLTSIAFEDEEEAIAIANSVDYGLAGYVWTSDVGRAHRVADQLEVGMVWVNSQNVRHLGAPFGGTKRSGIGRDGGDWSFDFYMETKNVSIALDTHQVPNLASGSTAE